MNDFAKDPDFERILNLQPSDIDRPKPLPQGMYLCVIKDPYELVKSSVKGTPGVQFIFHVIGVIDGVDMADLDAIGGYNGRTIYHTFWLPADNPDGMRGRQDYRLHNFLDHCGIPEGMMRERLDASLGAQFGAKITKDPKSETPRNIVTGTFDPSAHQADERLPLRDTPKAPIRAGRR